MPGKEYLTPEERARFDNPPILNADQKSIFLESPQWVAEYFKTLQTPSNQVGFPLQVGYFRIVSRFFGSNRVHQSDVDYVAEEIRLMSTRFR